MWKNLLVAAHLTHHGDRGPFPLVVLSSPLKARLAIDSIAQARAELEEANARLMLAIRHGLTPEPQEKMNQQRPRPRHGGPGAPGGPGGPMPGQGPGRPPQE